MCISMDLTSERCEKKVAVGPGEVRVFTCFQHRTETTGHGEKILLFVMEMQRSSFRQQALQLTPLFSV